MEAIPVDDVGRVCRERLLRYASLTSLFTVSQVSLLYGN